MPEVLACGVGFDVSEEEGDGAAGTIAHDPLQTLGWTWFYPIVARGHGDQANGVKVDRLGPVRRRRAEPELIEDVKVRHRVPVYGRSPVVQVGHERLHARG